MDANRQLPFQLAKRGDWSLDGDPAGLFFDTERTALRLTSARPRTFTEDESTARARLLLTPSSFDRFGATAAWDAAEQRVLATGAFPGSVPIYTALPGEAVSDVAIGYDDVLYLVANGRLLLKDLRNRWEVTEVPAPPGFTPWRVAAAAAGGAYVLDQASRRLARVRGLPMRRLRAVFDPEVFRPEPEDPDPPRLQVLSRAQLPADEEVVALASSVDGKVALLTWRVGGDARLRLLDDRDGFGPAQVLTGARFPFSLAFVGKDRIALLMAFSGPKPLAEALVYPLLSATSAVQSLPVGDIYPLRDHSGGPFLHGTEAPPAYPTSSDPGLRRLIPIASPAFLARGVARNALPLDSGVAHTVWHRLYLEANIPAGCSARVFLAATEEERAPTERAEWHEHRFGILDDDDDASDVPRGAWLRERSEISFHPGLLQCPTRKGQAGLFTALVQRTGRRVRSLTGRYLWVEVELNGNGRSSPELPALRVYAPRRSYMQYLPELYRESSFGPEADQAGKATRPDFLERFLGLFESVLTPLEDRIRDAYVLTTPRGVPTDALAWLASWIGFGFIEGLPEERRRELLAHARELYVKRGTLAGLSLALDLVSGGAVQRGAILVVEDFRLRRTFATILGADLSQEDDPLLPGLSVSGNSIVGDTLFLGDEQAKEFLALFGRDALTDLTEASAVASLFDGLAHRATVLVHADMQAQDLGLINSVVNREAPAHVEVKIVTASQRFLVGVASLLGVDTFVESKPAPANVRVDLSAIGRGDTVAHVPSLDPRLGSSPAEQPVAALAAVAAPIAGQPFTLDGGASRAAAGRRIVRYHWTLVR